MIMPEHQHLFGRRLASTILCIVAGTLIYVFGSHLLKTQSALQAQQERVELYLMSDPVAKIACNVDHEIIIANLAAEKMFGFKHGELVGKPVEILIPLRNRAAHERAIDAAKTRIAAQQGDWMLRQAVETEALRSDGTEFNTLMDIRTIKYGHPPRIEFLASMVDIDKEIILKPESKPLPKVVPTVPPPVK